MMYSIGFFLGGSTAVFVQSVLHLDPFQALAGVVVGTLAGLFLIKED